MCDSQLSSVAFKGMHCSTFSVAVNKGADGNDLWWDVFILTHRFIGLPFIIGGKT